MNEAALRQPRRVLPRWRLFNTTARLGELELAEKKPSLLTQFDDGSLLISRWKEEKNIGTAAEILNFATFTGNIELAQQAAGFIEANRTRGEDRNPLENLSLATFRTDGIGTEDEWFQTLTRPSKRDIPTLRKALRIFPNNAIAWAELSLLHAQIGNKEHARKCMLVAVGLAPNDRFVLRSAVRCFAHLRDREHSLKIINRSDRTKHDPWLLSAQIAMTQALEKPQRLMKNARMMAESKNFSAWDTSELHAAIGSVLHHDGAVKNANKHFRASLIEPTENALCQVIFDRQTEDWRKVTNTIHPSKNFESEARNHYLELELDEASASAEQWLADEPFSARPAMFGSFVAGIALSDYKKALSFIETGLKPNPNSPYLLNNKALCLARSGKIPEAEVAIQQAILKNQGDAEMSIVLEATQALILFRKGEHEAGRVKYNNAVSTAKKSGKSSLEALALVFLGQEELDAGTPEAKNAIAKALTAVRKLPHTQLDTRIAMAKLLASADEVEEATGQGAPPKEKTLPASD